MKSIKIVATLFLVAVLSSTLSAQVKTETFKVSGNCGMCKTKIEKAAKDAGAKDATWDAEKQTVTVSYKSSTTNAAKIQQKIADVGYDNAGFKATTEAYNKLHGCCKYERADAETTKAACCSGDTKCTHEHSDGASAKMDCCKDGKCTKDKCKDCCKDGKMNCCKDGKCTKEGHTGSNCCKNESHH